MINKSCSNLCAIVYGFICLLLIIIQQPTIYYKIRIKLLYGLGGSDINVPKFQSAIVLEAETVYLSYTFLKKEMGFRIFNGLSFNFWHFFFRHWPTSYQSI